MLLVFKEISDKRSRKMGQFKLAGVSFAGHELLIFDSPPAHDFSVTSSMSLFVDFDT